MHCVLTLFWTIFSALLCHLSQGKEKIEQYLSLQSLSCLSLSHAESFKLHDKKTEEAGPGPNTATKTVLNQHNVITVHGLSIPHVNDLVHGKQWQI